MPILDLSLGQRQRLLAEMLAENPAMASLPTAYFDFVPVPVNGKIETKIVGHQGRIGEGLTGKRLLRYPQFDLSRYFANITVTLPIYRPVSVHELLPILAKRYGLKIDPAFVYDDPVAETNGPVEIRFTEGAMLFKQASFTVQVKLLPVPPTTVDLTTYINPAELNGFTADVQLDLVEISKGWSAPEYGYWLSTRTVGGPYEAQTLAEVVNAASPVLGPWVCANNVALNYNLWNAYIAYNDVIDDPEYDGMLTHCIRLALAPEYTRIPNATLSTYVLSIYY